jgi:hypothetical protein
MKQADKSTRSNPDQPDLVVQIVKFCIDHKISYGERLQMMTAIADGKAMTLTEALAIVRWK